MFCFYRDAQLSVIFVPCRFTIIIGLLTTYFLRYRNHFSLPVKVKFTEKTSWQGMLSGYYTKRNRKKRNSGNVMSEEFASDFYTYNLCGTRAQYGPSEVVVYRFRYLAAARLSDGIPLRVSSRRYLYSTLWKHTTFFCKKVSHEKKEFHSRRKKELIILKY